MKKLLSIILAAAMILSLIPSVFAEGEGTEETTTYVYNFSKKDDDSNVAVGAIDDYYTKDDNEEYTVYNPGKYDDYADNRNWKYFGMSDALRTYYEGIGVTSDKRRTSAGFDAHALVFKADVEDQWLALKIRVPEAGIYQVSTKIRQHEDYLTNGFMSIYPGNTTLSGIKYDGTTGGGQVFNSARLLSSSIAYRKSSVTTATDVVIPFDGKLLVVNASNDEFVYVLGSVNGIAKSLTKNITLTKVSDKITFGDTTSVNLVLGENETPTVTASLESGMRIVGGYVVNYSTENSNIATVTSKGVVTAVGEGKTTLTARIGDVTASIPVTVTAPEEDEQFTNEFTGENGYTEGDTKAFTEAKTTANFYSAVVGGTVEMNETTLLKADDEVALGTQYSYTAPEKEGLIFRYWAKALTDEKLIVTRNATVKFMPTTETTNLVAVYEPENGATVTGESFYNANGQLLTDVKISAEKMPPLPSMTGYGTASAWVQYGTGTEFAEGADAPTENLMFIAKYGEPTTTFAIDVVDGSGSGNYTYGEEVTCTATVPEGKVFKCWTKTPEGSETAKIISLDEEYIFNAWESCTITAVFADKAPVFTGNKFSIILSSMGTVDSNTAYMAEFVGLENAVEKGIQFGNKRVAMTTDAAQFTAVDDTKATDVKGYAILSDGTVIYDK